MASLALPFYVLSMPIWMSEALTIALNKRVVLYSLNKHRLRREFGGVSPPTHSPLLLLQDPNHWYTRLRRVCLLMVGVTLTQKKGV